MDHILAPIIGPLTDILKFLTITLNSYGLAIIIFTLLVRGILSPLNLRQLRQSRRMAALAPKLKELQQRYKGNREELTRETMRLYKEEGVNPAAGCMPLLVQLPILYAMFYVFQELAHKTTPAIYHAQFLWFTLDKPDHLFGHFFLGANSYWGPLPILTAATQWVQSRMIMQPTTDPQQRATQQIMQFMPLFILFFAVNYPSGLALYWLTSTIFSIVMQYFIMGWGLLFTSPFHLSEPAAGGGSAGGGSSRKGGPARGSGADSATVTLSGRDKNDKSVTTDDSRAEAPPPLRPGKMQRAVMRPAPRGAVRTRSSKGAKR